MCVSVAAGQLRALSEKLQANSYYVYSEAAPAHARAGPALTERQLAAYPNLVRTLSQSGQGISSDIKLVELSTLGGAPASCYHIKSMCRLHGVYLPPTAWSPAL